MEPYSLDLRKRIVESYLNKEGSIRQVAARFKVARSYVQKLLAQYRREGNLDPKPRGGKVGACTKLTEEHLEGLKEIAKQYNDATLADIQDELYKRYGVWVSISTVSRRLIEMKVKRKKTS